MDGKYIYFDGQTYQISTVLWSCGASTNIEVVAAVASKKIRVLYYTFSASTTTTFYFASAAASISGNISCSTTQLFAPYVPYYFETVAGEALNLYNSSATTVRGIVAYISY